MKENNEKNILDTKKAQLKEQEEKLEALQKRGEELDETEQKLATMKEEIERRKNSTTTKTEVAETTPVVEKEEKLKRVEIPKDAIYFSEKNNQKIINSSANSKDSNFAIFNINGNEAEYAYTGKAKNENWYEGVANIENGASENLLFLNYVKTTEKGNVKKENGEWVITKPAKILFTNVDVEAVGENKEGNLNNTNQKIELPEEKSPARKKKGIKEIEKVENSSVVEENVPTTEETPPIEKQEEQEEPEELKVETSNNNNQTNNMANEEQNFQTPRANNQVEDNTISPEENISSVDNEKVGALLEPQNEGLWNKMSSKGKQIMSGVYEGIYKTPVVNRLVGKMEIAYNQFWIDKKEEKAVELKGKMDTLNVRRESLSDVQNEIRNAALELEEDGISGSNKLMLRHKGLEKQKTKIEKKEDKLQGRIEKRENRISLYTNKRDAIADRLITHYEKKLSPIEGRLEVLEDKQNKVELISIAAEVKLDEQYAKLKNLEERKMIIEKKYTAAGFTERQIGRDPVIKELASKINNGYSNIQIEKGIIAAKRDEVNRRVAKIDKKAEPYRNRKNEFIRVKDNRPVKIDLEKRVEPREFKGREETTSHTRYENPDGYNYGGETKSSQDHTEYVGSAFENMHEFSNLISNYNGLIDGVIKKDKKLSVLQVDEKDLIKATKISRTSRMNTKNFARILEQYYKTKKIPESVYKNITSKLK